MEPSVDNQTPFAVETLFVADERARPVLTTVVKGTYDVRGSTLSVAEEQAQVNLEGELHGDDPAVSSYRFEPEVAFTKLATDIVLLGQAHAPRVGVTDMTVGVRVGAVEKTALVLGDRVWFKSLGEISSTSPARFEKIPLVWERAFGGWDRSSPDRARHVCDSRNPVGVGVRPSRVFEDGLRLPNIEDPAQPLRRFGEAVPPTGFGFVSPHWQPRAALAGTYDERWQKERAPALPRDFDRRHLNAASTGLVAPGYLRGDEPVIVVGVTPEGPLRFNLPGLPPPEILVALKGQPSQPQQMNLDTVIIDADSRKVFLLWRALTPLSRGPLDVRAVKITRSS